MNTDKALLYIFTQLLDTFKISEETLGYFLPLVVGKLLPSCFLRLVIVFLQSPVPEAEITTGSGQHVMHQLTKVTQYGWLSLAIRDTCYHNIPVDLPACPYVQIWLK